MGFRQWLLSNPQQIEQFSYSNSQWSLQPQTQPYYPNTPSPQIFYVMNSNPSHINKTPFGQPISYNQKSCPSNIQSTTNYSVTPKANQLFTSAIRAYNRTYRLQFDEIKIENDFDYAMLNRDIFLFFTKTNRYTIHNSAPVFFGAVCAYLEKQNLLQHLLTGEILIDENRRPSLARFIIEENSLFFTDYFKKFCEIQPPLLTHFDHILKTILSQNNDRKNQLLDMVYDQIHPLGNLHPFNQRIKNFPQIDQYFSEKKPEPKNTFDSEELIKILRSGDVLQFQTYCAKLKNQFEEFYKKLSGKKPDKECFIDNIKINYGACFAKKKIGEIFIGHFNNGFNPLNEIYESKNINLLIAYKNYLFDLFEDNLEMLKDFLQKQAKSILHRIEKENTEMAKHIKNLAFCGELVDDQSRLSCFQHAVFLPSKEPWRLNRNKSTQSRFFPEGPQADEQGTNHSFTNSNTPI